MTDHLESALANLRAHANANRELTWAYRDLKAGNASTARECLARALIHEGGTSIPLADSANGIKAVRDLLAKPAAPLEPVNVLLSYVRKRVRDTALERADQAGRLLARDVVAGVRQHSSNAGSEPIYWLTGNSYVPALRSLPAAESVWDLPVVDHELEPEHWPGARPWHVFVETFEGELEREDVYLGAPEYDNSLYCVDLRVWEHVPEGEGELPEDLFEREPDLADEWRRKEDA